MWFTTVTSEYRTDRAQLIKLLSILSCTFTLPSSCSSYADPTPDRRTIFEGRNVYSPSIEYDGSTHMFKMWYGGWQADADYPNDKIYYRQSKDGVNWSGPRTVLTPSQLPTAISHVNDPSVVTAVNSITKKVQYTMFYTACVKPCSINSENQLWSAVSDDGLHWILHKPLVRAEGAAVPTAVSLDSKGIAVWRVYYSKTSEDNNKPTHIYMVGVDGDRNALAGTAIAYTYRGPGVISNPEVRKISGTWDLLFNVYRRPLGAKRDTADIYVAQSTSSTEWRSGSEMPLITNDPNGSVCATVAPALITFHDRLILQFGQARYNSSGACDFSNFESMQQISAEASWLERVATRQASAQ